MLFRSHIISINNTNIEIQKGNFSSWQENKNAQDNFEFTQNEKLKKEINRLEIASQNTAKWSDKIEKSKFNTTNSGSSIDRGYVGHKSAKMMKKSKVMEKRTQKAIQEKSSLLKNVDRNDCLKIVPLETKQNLFVLANNFQIKYNHKSIFAPVSFEIKKGDRVAIIGENGIGKSSILKLLFGNQIDYQGDIKIAKDLKISYVSQSTETLKGNLKEFAIQNKIEESIFKAMLSKMGFSKSEFDKKIEEMSEGQKKKVLVAKSISESANFYIWDEPLNYIDILTRIQIEEVILKNKPTMIFVEHDETFVKNIATKVIHLIDKCDKN